MNIANDNINNAEQSSSSENATIYTEETVNNLKDGLLELFQPKLEGVKTQLSELTTKQNLLIEQLHNENLKLASKQNSEEFQEMFRKIQVYRNKLVNMKSDMKSLHNKSQNLVKRSVRLQTLKEKDDQLKKEQREKELKLIGNN